MNTFSRKEKVKHLLSLPVIVAALGYFVDIYDLILFGVVRVPSLESMNISLDVAGTTIQDWQMFGLMLGGILWGVLGDKKGRLSVLFGSILVYSLANIMCGFLPYVNFMDKVSAYAVLRFIAGIGLAGELGAGITLVAESLPKELRAIGTSIVAGFGLLGAVVANFTVELSGDWKIAYFVGGGMGILLLIFRIGVAESGIYKDVLLKAEVQKGNFMSFFTNGKRLVRYLKVIAIGLPTWFCIGILAFLANEFSEELGVKGRLEPGTAIMWAYIGISVGDFMSGFISQWLQSRKKAILWMINFTILGVVLMLFTNYSSPNVYYFYCVWLGLGTGYWAMFVTVGAEQFGTNIRATAATTIPNMVRGMLIPMNFLFYYFISSSFSKINSALVVGVVVFTLALFATLTIEETHGKDLDYVE